jgi:RNA polymerase sigma-70 factor (ECF subfamily)
MISAFEARVVVRAQQGDDSARNELASHCQRQAYLFALQLSGNREDALDVAQDAMLRFFGALPRFDPSRPVRPWLLRIVRNLIYDRSRRRKVRPAEVCGIDPEVVIEPRAPGLDPEALTARHQLQRVVWSAVQELSDDHREVVVLRDYMDLSYEEIARVLKVPRGTVMSRLHRARQKLRQQVLAQMQADRSDGGEVYHA